MSLREIARKLGISPTCVSMALRDTGRVSPAMRRKIKATAQAMDYHVHPIVSRGYSLARGSAKRYRETLALITESAIRPRYHYQQRTYDGAKERADALGYKLEIFIVSGRRSEQEHLSRMLVARGIRGLLIIPRVKSSQPRLYFDWNCFAAVEIHPTLWYPHNLHQVGTRAYAKMLEALHLLKRMGFKRIGLAIEPYQDHHERGIFNAAYLGMQSKLPPSQRIPPLLSYGPWNEKTFRRWLKRYRPDVLYRHNLDVYNWVKNLGLRVPEDISLFCTNINNDDLYQSSGLCRDYFRMGQSAVEMVSLLLGNNTLGLSASPRCWLVDELWQVGTSLRYSMADYISEEGVLVR